MPRLTGSMGPREFNINDARVLIRNKVPLDRENDSCMTALMEAVVWGDVKAVECLVKAGATVDYVSRKGETALMLAAEHWRVETVEYLIKAGARVDRVNREGKTVLMLMAKGGRVETVECLIKAGARVDQVSRWGETALMLAARSGHAAMVEYLIKAGMGVDQVNESGNTALMLAAREGHVGTVETVECLIVAGANVDHANHAGDTALMFAVEHIQWGVISCLIEAGANTDHVNRAGETVWAKAWAKARNTDILALLDVVPYELIGAVTHRSPAFVKRRIEKEKDTIDLSVVDPSGKTVFTSAAKRGDAMVKVILGEALIDVNASEADFNAALSWLNRVTETLKKDNLKKDRKIVRSYLVKFLNEDYQAELSHPSLDRLNVCLLRLNAIKDNLQVIQPNEEEQKKGKQKTAMQAIDSLILAFNEKIAAIQPPAENSISAKLLALFQGPDAFKITSGLMFELVNPSPDQVGEIRRIVAGLPVEQRKQLRSALSRTLSETAAKNELADPDQWIKVLHEKYKDEGKSIPFIAILRVNEDGKKTDYNTSSWSIFMRIMKNGQFTKGAVKSHVEKVGTFKERKKEDETGQLDYPKLTKHKIGNKDL